MFNWTTTTLINELPFIKADGEKLRIGNKLFEKRWVENIRKAEGHKMELCEATVDMTEIAKVLGDAKIARLYIYVGVEGSEESIYANDWYRKGMPLSVSFAVGSAADMATAIADTIKTFNVFTKVKKVLDVTASGAVLTIKGTHEYQRLNKIAILVEDTSKDNILHEEKVVAEYEKNRKDAAGITIVNPGVNGFGTYSQLLKDLRLPTANHNHWLSVQKDEMPIVGAVYTQYIVNYYAPSTANPSFTAVGNRSMSETTHVFWVNTSAAAKDEEGNDTTVGALWEAALAAIDPDGDGKLDTTSVVAGKKVYSNKKAESIVSGN
jgi:hypothetical protein